ncbi:hypothetical protein [Novilysobacter arseniciresistens]|uniref:hypothetical protein n=1 Tax=Novilysobacter arseniciresistens TaxID=1385522 RepID=UPI001269A410|nr:hypothetical protein [Lysobacter arseniciresistens]
MNRHTLPRALFWILVAGAGPAFAGSALPPLHAELVDDATLSQVSGKFFGANMLVGLRIDLVSTMHSAQGGTAYASGSMQVVPDGNGGYLVQVHTDSGAGAGNGAALADGRVASGGEQLQVNGIGQVAQIAGDGNRLGNLTAISFTDATSAGGSFNGQASSASAAGAMSASISFDPAVGASLSITGPGSLLAQQIGSDAAGGSIRQLGQIAADNVTAQNQLRLQLFTAAMPDSWQQHLGIKQALAGMDGVGR